MLRNYYFGIVATLALALTSCIESYEPEIESKDAVKLVVTGQVNKGDKVQNVNISATSPVSEPKYFPVMDCRVKIIDARNNQYEAIDMKDGNYKIIIPESELIIGSSFKVDIEMPNGTHIVSDFDELTDCPEVDSVYFIVGSLPSINPYVQIKGIQFYVDLNAVNVTNRYFRWEAIETWEFRAVYPIEYIYDGKVHHIVPPDNSLRVCWKTTMVNNVFTLSTKNLAENKYKAFPLQFVDNISSSRLVYGMSLLIRQYSHSKAAFDYWEKLRINNAERGGLYEKQPLSIKGNLHNLTNPDKQVLGFFGASKVTSKRLFVSNILGLSMEYNPGCGIEFEKPLLTFKGVAPPYPVYLYATPYSFLIIVLPPYCYDCRQTGGDTIKPTYWPY